MTRKRGSARKSMSLFTCTVALDGVSVVDVSKVSSVKDARVYLRGFKNGRHQLGFAGDTGVVAWVMRDGLVHDPERDPGNLVRPVETIWGSVFLRKNHLIVMDATDSVVEVITDDQFAKTENTPRGNLDTGLTQTNSYFGSKAAAAAAWIIASMPTISLSDFADKWTWDPFQMISGSPVCCREVLRRSPEVLQEIVCRPDAALVFLETLGKEETAAYPELERSVLRTLDREVAAKAIHACQWLQDRRLALTAAGVSPKQIGERTAER